MLVTFMATSAIKSAKVEVEIVVAAAEVEALHSMERTTTRLTTKTVPAL